MDEKPLFPAMQKDTSEIVREAERAVCRKVYEVVDSMAGEYWTDQLDVYALKERLEEELAYGPDDV